MRRFADDDEVDLVIVGAGAGGSVLAQRLARHGWRIVILEAGPFWHPDEDWVSDEAGSHRLYWTQKRIIGGADPIELGKNNSGRGVGGSMVHYAGYTPRFHPSDFATEEPRRGGRRLADRLRGPAAALRAGRARAAGRRPGLAVGRPAPLPALPAPGLRRRGACCGRARERCGIEMRVGPVGIVNGTFGNRPHCIYRGYCLQGCKVNAKASPYVTHLPDALAHGVEVRADCMALRVEIDDGTGRGTRRDLRASDGPRAASSAPGSSPSPATRSRRRGCCWTRPAAASRTALGNDDDQVGRYVMVQGAAADRRPLPEELRMYKAPPPEISSEQFYETDPGRGFARGFSIQTVSPLPIGWAEHVLADGHWGRALREYMRDYNHWATIGRAQRAAAAAGQPGHPRRRDRPVRPAGRAHGLHASATTTGPTWPSSTNVIERDPAAPPGAQDVLTIQRYAHLIGGCPDGRLAREQRRRRRPPRPGTCRTFHRRRLGAARPRARPTRR